MTFKICDEGPPQRYSPCPPDGTLKPKKSNQMELIGELQCLTSSVFP